MRLLSVISIKSRKQFNNVMYLVFFFVSITVGIVPVSFYMIVLNCDRTYVCLYSLTNTAFV